MIFYGRGLNETVFMIFEPKQRSRKMSVSFPKFKLGGSLLEFVKSVKYLVHMITATLADDWDIQWEIRNMFTRTNILALQMLKLFYLKHIVFLYMTLICGSSTVQ